MLFIKYADVGIQGKLCVNIMQWNNGTVYMWKMKLYHYVWSLQVMKMVTLTASEAGSVFYIKRPGAVLDAGSLIAHLELDDLSLVTKAQEYKGQFPELEVSTPVVGEKLNHMNASYRVMLENILAGTFIFIKLV